MVVSFQFPPLTLVHSFANQFPIVSLAKIRPAGTKPLKRVREREALGWAGCSVAPVDSNILVDEGLDTMSCGLRSFIIVCVFR